MGKRLKRGKAGNAALYMTRNQAIKKLQLPLSQFRRLCILKGIHPREPKKKPQGSNKTYYHAKDVNWLLHEPILQVLRDVKAHGKKVRKARAKKNERLAKRLMRLKPGYRLDHLVKERYPTFVDALRDLDDALTLVHLFAALPSDSRRNVPRATVETARRLATEWAAYVARSGSLRRVFVSVKGYYYQAEVMGQAVTWLQPHALQQVLPDDVDCRVLLTFQEFYATLVQFVLFRLYRGLGLQYPPVLDERLEKAAAGLAALMRGVADAQDAARAQRAAAGGGGGGAEAGGEEAGAALAAAEAPDVVQRIGTLAARIKQLEAEAEGEEDDDDQKSEEDEDDDDEDAIDSGAEEQREQEDGDGDEAEEEEEEESGGGDDDDEAEAEEEDADQAAAKDAAAAAPADPDNTKEEDASAAGGALAVDPDDDAAVCASLLRGCVVFLSRETPREPLLLVIKAFGGTPCWDGPGSPHGPLDAAVTHAVVDRPAVGSGRFSAGARLVQPQWAFDSANFRVLMPERLYAPGLAPPPHLSPFVDPEDEGYTPEFYATVRKLQEAARRARLRAAGRLAAGEFAGGGDDDAAALAAREVADALEDDEAAAQAYARDLEREVRKARAEEGDEEDDEEEDEEDDGEADEKAPAAAAAKKANGGGDGDEMDEAAKMKDIMMNTRTRKLYGRIQRAVQGKRERGEALERRREELGKKQQQQQQREPTKPPTKQEAAAATRPKRQRQAKA